MRKLSILFLALFMALSWIISPGVLIQAEESKAIKIGVFESLSGENAEGGNSALQGIQLAHAQKAQVLGRLVELVSIDNHSSTAEAIPTAEALVKEGVCAVIGSHRSDYSIPAGEVFQAAQIPAITEGATNPLVTQSNPYYFRVNFVDSFQGDVMAKFAVREFGAKKAAIISDYGQAYAVGLVKYFADTFVKEAGDDSIIAKLSYTSGEKDFTPLLQYLVDKKPDVIFCPGQPLDAVKIVKAARELGITAPILGGDTWHSQELLEGLEAMTDPNVYFCSHFDTTEPLHEVSEDFIEAFEKAYDKKPDAYAALGYDAYMLVMDAIERAESYEAEDIKTELAKTQNFIGATGTMTMLEDQNPSKEAVILRVGEAAYEFVTYIYPDQEK